MDGGDKGLKSPLFRVVNKRTKKIQTECCAKSKEDDMIKRNLIKRVMAAGAIMAVTLSLAGCGIGGSSVKLGAAGVGGGYYAFFNAFAQIASEEDEDLDFEVKATAGSSANIRLLSDGYVDMAIAQADLVDAAYNGTGATDKKRYRGYSAVASLYTEACQIVVRADSGIDSLDDLQGKKISVGEEESGTQRNAEQILKMTGLVESLVDTVNLDYVDAANELKSGQIDAFFCTAGIQTSVIEELSKECDVKLIGIDDKCRDRLKSVYGFYTDYTIPAGTYEGQDQDVETLGIRAVLLARDDMDEEIVEKLTGLLFEHVQDIQYSIALTFQIDESEAVKNVTIPFHDGAKAYYQKKGIEIPAEQ